MKFILLLLLLVSSSIHAQQCFNPTIEILPFEVIVDYNKGYKQLQEMGPASGEIGLVKTTSSITVLGCKATVGYKNPMLYVARELKRNRCAFEDVKTHEFTHIRIYEEALATLADRIITRVNSGVDLFIAAKEETLSVSILQQAFDDSPEEISDNRTACGGIILKLIPTR